MNEYSIDGDVVTIQLTQGKVATIDLADLPRVQEHYWYADFTGQRWYVSSARGKKGKIRLHRFLTNAPRGALVDHKDNDGFNNRRENLRIVTKAQNAQNRHTTNPLGSRNVYRSHAKGLLRVGVSVGGKHHYGGYFPDTPEGLLLADSKAREMRLALFTHSDGR